jgi:hypothetical protein
MIEEKEGTMTFLIGDDGKFVGAWEIGGPMGLIVYLTEKPNIFRRFFARFFFGVKWINNK